MNWITEPGTIPPLKSFVDALSLGFAEGPRSIMEGMMTFFDDLIDAVKRYPDNGTVTMEICNIGVHTGTPGAINVGETWEFDVRFDNHGALNMANVILFIDGRNGITVGKRSTGPFSPSILSDPENINAGDVYNHLFGKFYFKAPANPMLISNTLLRAKIQSFDLDLSTLLKRINPSVSASDVYKDPIYP